MEIILYNPLSNKGKNIKIAEKLHKKAIKEKRSSKIVNLLEIKDVQAFLNGYNEEDRMILIGGDGTLNRVVNQIKGIVIKPQLYMYKAGTGNDFMRSIKSKKHLVDIKPYIQNLPILKVNGKEELFLNGAGVGLDGLVCYNVNTSKESKNKSNYFKNAFKSFMSYKPVSVLIDVDGKVWEENKVWFVTAMNAPYFGGGMKLAPKKLRELNHLELVVIKKVPRWLIFMIFPTIYLGWHKIFRSFVRFYKGQHIKVSMLTDSYLQRDGEHEYPVREFEVFKNK